MKAIKDKILDPYTLRKSILEILDEETKEEIQKRKDFSILMKKQNAPQSEI